MKRKVFLFAGVVLLLFIWAQSFLPSSISSGESAWFTNTIVNPFLRLLGLAPLEDGVVRKLAHVGEFFLFSLFAALWWNDRAWKSVYTGFTAAFLDESIQILSERGSLVSDIWVDLLGVLLGSLFGCLLCGKLRTRTAQVSGEP